MWGAEGQRRRGQQPQKVTGSCSGVWIHTKNDRERLKAETETDMIIPAFKKDTSAAVCRMDLRGGQAWKPRAGWEVTAAVQLRRQWLR